MTFRCNQWQIQRILQKVARILQSSNLLANLFEVSVDLSISVGPRWPTRRDFIEADVSDTACCQLVSANEYGLSRTAVPRQRWKCRIGAARFDRSILSAVATAFEGRIVFASKKHCGATRDYDSARSPPCPLPPPPSPSIYIPLEFRDTLVNGNSCWPVYNCRTSSCLFQFKPPHGQLRFN